MGNAYTESVQNVLSFRHLTPKEQGAWTVQ